MPATTDLPGQRQLYAGKLLTCAGPARPVPSKQYGREFRPLTKYEVSDLEETAGKIAELAECLDKWPTWHLTHDDSMRILNSLEAARDLAAALRGQK